MKDLKVNNIELSKKNNELETDIRDLKIKNLELEDVKKKNNELESDMKNLKVNNIELSKKNNELEKDIKDLQVKNLEFEDIKKNNVLELNNIELGKKNTSLESKFEKLDKELLNVKELLSKTIIQNINEEQKNLEKIDILWNIKERDNYNAFLYMILISLGDTFESIWNNKSRAINSNKKFKLNDELLNLFNQLGSIIIYYNEEAYEAIESNIYEELFPKSNGNLKKFFPDAIVNQTKEIVRGLKNYVNKKNENDNDNEQSKKFEEKMNLVTKKIREIFQTESKK